MLKEIFTVQGEEGERKGETRRHCKGEKEVEMGVMSAGEQSVIHPQASSVWETVGVLPGWWIHEIMLHRELGAEQLVTHLSVVCLVLRSPAHSPGAPCAGQS